MTTSITALNVATITQALVDQLTASMDLSDATIVRSADRSLDPSDCPWIGVYRMSSSFEQRTLGFGGGVRNQRIRLLVLVEASDMLSGEACEIALEKLLASVIGAILSDTTLGGNVNALEQFDVDYLGYQRSGTVYMQTAALQFVAVGTTTAQTT